MKILCVTENLGSGGAERQLSHLAVLLKREGHDVTFVTWSGVDFYGRHLDENGVRRILFPSSGKLSRTFRLVRLIRKDQPEWVISYLTGPNQTCCLAKLFCRFKLLVSERNFTFNWGCSMKIATWLYQKADAVVANSQSEAENLRRHCPKIKERVCSIPNFVEIDRFCPGESKRTEETVKIIGVGRITPQKNILGAILAYKKVLDTGRHCVFEWYGAVRDEEYCKQVLDLRKALKVEDGFILKGECSHLETVYADADIFCLTSLWEGYPNVVVEAMSCALPIACSNLYENPYIVADGENGILFDPHDTSDMASALCRLIDMSASDREEIGRRNRSKVMRVNAESAFIESYLQLLTSN